MKHILKRILKRILRRYLPFLLCSLFIIGMLAGCKLRPSNTAQPTATKTAVTISLEDTQFKVSEPLGVLIKNTGSTNVYALDGRASCTILELQQYDSQKKAWVAVDRCRDTVQPHVLIIPAGMSEAFTLAPGSAGDPNSWESGTYRIAVSFSTQPDGKTAAQVAYSQGFTIEGS